MKLNLFDRTTPANLRLGLGLAALGRPGYINLGHADDLGGDYAISSMAQQTHAVLDAAWAAGIRYFDAARSYGRAEEFLGSWLQQRDIPASTIMVGSKWGYTYTADWQVEAKQHEVKEHSLETFQKQWPETEHFLGSYLNLYQIHSATLESGVLNNQAVLKALAGLKADGTLVGLSLSGPAQATTLAQAVEIVIDGVRLFDAVQATWNILEPSAGSMLQLAHEMGLGVIIKEGVANGRLTPRNQEPALADTLNRLTAQATRLNCTLDGLALAAVLAQPWADIVLSGAATVAHLQSNLQALEVVWDDEAAQTVSQLAEPPALYWQTRKNLAWN